MPPYRLGRHWNTIQAYLIPGIEDDIGELSEEMKRERGGLTLAPLSSSSAGVSNTTGRGMCAADAASRRARFSARS